MGKPHKAVLALSLLAGAAVTALALYGFVLLRERPGLPPDVSPRDLVSINGIEISRAWDDLYALAWTRAGEPARFEVRRPDGTTETRTLPVARFFGREPFPLVYVVIGLFTLAVGALTFRLRWRDPKARIFYWACLAFSFALIVSGETYGLHAGSWTTFVPSLVFIFAYSAVPALVLHFALAFSPGRRAFRPGLVYLPAALFAAGQAGLFLAAFLRPSQAAFRAWASHYYLFRLYVIAFLVAAIFRLGAAARRTTDDIPRAQLRWIFFGLALGVLPFLILFQLPMALQGIDAGSLASPLLRHAVQALSRPLVSEEAAILPFLLIPISFAIAIVRYHLMAIDVVINRSLVYSALTVVVVGIYLFVVRLAERLLARGSAPGLASVYSLAGMLVAAAAFHPAQKRIQLAVDKAFFRQRYDYRRAVLTFAGGARASIGREALSDLLLGSIRSIVPVERLGLLMSIVKSESGAGDLFVRGDALPVTDLVDLDGGRAALSAATSAAAATAAAGMERGGEGVASGGEKSLDAGEGEGAAASAGGKRTDLIRSPFLEARGLEFLLPLPLTAAGSAGVLGFGRKRSGQPFSRDDLYLLRTMAAEAAANFDRILLQEEVIYERAAKEKLDELSRLKTEFISSVSHEIRTPMSSIQGLAEILQSGKVKSPEQRESYLRLMALESGRLSRLLHNVLDFGRIEQGTERYHTRDTDLALLVEGAVEVFRPRLEELGFKQEVRLPPHPVRLAVDPDAVSQCLLNLIDNAIKYSPVRRELEISLVEGARAVEIRVRDRGIGIAPAERPRIFDRFYRAEAAGRLDPRGAGLGLMITRRIMNAHGGDVFVDSEEGEGSVFRLVFPKP